MSDHSPNLNLNLYTESDSGEKFRSFLENLTGPGVDSNMMLLDAAIHALAKKLEKAALLDENGRVPEQLLPEIDAEKVSFAPGDAFQAAIGDVSNVSDALEQVGMVSANVYAHITNTENPHGITAAQIGAVPTGRTINGLPLSGDIALTASDVGAQALRNGVAVTIPAGESAWGTDSTQEYSRYWDLAVSGLTARDRADVMIAPTSFAAAKECGLCPGSETFAGKIRLRAKTAPASAITAEYWIEKGMV